MNPRNTILMLLVVLGVGAFYYFHDVKGGAERKEAEEKEARLFPDLESKDVTAIKVSGAKAKEPLVLQKVDGRWILEGEPKLLASQSEVGRTAEDLAGLKRESVVAEEPTAEQLKEYGLDQPGYVVEVGKATLQVGNKTPGENSYYARAGGAGPVVEVSSIFMGTLEKPKADLREKSPLAAEPGEVNRVKLVPASGEEILLVREEEAKPEGSEAEMMVTDPKWRLEKPMQAPADSRKVTDFLWAWRNLQAGRFLGAEEKIDFSKPRLRIEVWEGEAKEPRVVEVGPTVAVKPGMVYVRRLDPEEVMVVEVGKQEADLLGRTAGDFEDKHLLTFQEEDVDRVSADVEGTPFEARRIRDGWEIEKPEKASREEALVDSAVRDFLFSLSDLQWEAKGGAKFDQPRATVTLKKKGGEVIGVLRVGPAAEGGAWVMREGSDEVFRVKTDLVTRWKDTLKRLEPAPSPSPAAATPAAGTPAAATPAAATPAATASP